MEIPARGVRAQRPRRLMEALPRRQRQCVPEEEGDGLHGQRLRRHGPDRVELPVGKQAPRCGQGKTNEVRSRVPPKRIGLRRPVHVAERGGEPVEVMLGSLMVGDDHLLQRSVPFETTRPFQRTWPHRSWYNRSASSNANVPSRTQTDGHCEISIAVHSLLRSDARFPLHFAHAPLCRRSLTARRGT